MLKKYSKIIASIIISGLVLGLIFSVAFKPKQVQALDGGGSWATAIKEIVLDAISSVISDQILNRLMTKVQDWGLGRNQDSNEPFFVMDWNKLFDTALDLGSAEFLREFNLTKLCQPFNYALGEELGNFLGLTTYYSERSRYSVYAACTIDQVVGNAEAFWANPSITIYGWSAWDALNQPQNNLYGSVFMAQTKKENMEQDALTAKDKETAVSQGTQNETTTKSTDTDACTSSCKSQIVSPISCQEDSECETKLYAGAKCMSSICVMPGSLMGDCLAKCATTTKGLALDTTIKNWGKDINKAMEDTLGKDVTKLINADEISKLIGIFFSAVLNKAINGLGLAPQQTNATGQQIDRAQLQQDYSYLKTTKSDPEGTKMFQETLLSGMLKGIQQLSKSAMECTNSDAEMRFDDYAKNITDIVSANLEAYYAGISGINLKPDFEVLDPVDAPFTVYGSGWGEVPANKIPSKCRAIINQAKVTEDKTCKDIISGLEPRFSSQCASCMYDEGELNCPPDPKPPFPKGYVITDDILGQKQDFYNGCVGQYSITQQRCGDCTKKADEKCNSDNPTDKLNCINEVCNNYTDILPNIVAVPKSGNDFYNRCLIEEKKSACLTCLKEYFIPSQYCSIVVDYARRAITKYPTAVLYERTGAVDWDGYWIGPYNSIAAEARGGFCTDNAGFDPGTIGKIPLDLICRIMPDYTWGGTKICETCSADGMTQQELNSISDFRPNEKDCGKQALPIGGHDPLEAIRVGALNMNSKCCAALWSDDEKRYTSCIGSAEETTGPPPPPDCTYGKPVDQEPKCYCSDGWRPIASTRTGYTDESKNPLGGDCGNTMFSADNQHKMFIHFNNGDGTTDTAFVSQNSSCAETNEDLNNTDANDDKSPDGTTDATAPAQTVWSQIGETNWAQYCLPTLNGTYVAGVYHNDDSDIVSGIHICSQCNPSDAGYPYYGTDLNQCNDKYFPLEVPAECQ